MIDFHCHIDLYNNPHEVLEGIVDNQCFVLSVTTTPLAWDGNRSLIEGTPGVYIAAGLHPELVASRHNEIEQLCNLVPETKFIGEIGLDGTAPHRKSLPLQKIIFERILKTSERAGGRILSIHSRGASDIVINCLTRINRQSIPVLHWYSGTIGTLKAAIEIGCWFSINIAMLKTKKGESLVTLMPKNRVLTETDGPFTNYKGVPYLPWDTGQAVIALASIWNCSNDKVEEQLNTNLKSLLRNVNIDLNT